MKSLWAAEFDKIMAFPPGYIADITDGSIYLKPVKSLEKPRDLETNLESISNNLVEFLFNAVSERISDLNSIAIAFSGGLDSSLLALLCEKLGVEVQLISVGLSNESLKDSVEAAKLLELPIHTKIFSVEDLEKDLVDVVWAIERTDLMSVSIAVPLFWVAKEARELGFRVMFDGQGADELFGGYHKYLSVLGELGAEGLENTLFLDVVMSSEVNFARDEKVCAVNGVELRLPYIDWELVNYGLKIPPQLKICSSKDQLRKRILREASLKIGLPKDIAFKPKKAIQYSTGVNKAIRILAKRNGLKPIEYLEKLFMQCMKERI